MAFDKDAFLTALDGMSVMDLNDLVKAIEEKFGVSAASMAAPAAGAGGQEPQRVSHGRRPVGCPAWLRQDPRGRENLCLRSTVPLGSLSGA